MSDLETMERLRDDVRTERRLGKLSVFALLIACALVILLLARCNDKILRAIDRPMAEAGVEGASITERANALSSVYRTVQRLLNEAGLSEGSVEERLQAFADRCQPGSDPTEGDCYPEAVPCPSAENPRQEFLVYFVLSNAELTPTKRRVVERAAEAVNRCRVKSVGIYGHADRSGEDHLNEPLSRKRARVVEAELKKLVTAQVSWDVKGFGETRVRVETGDGEPNEENRRVEIVIQ